MHLFRSLFFFLNAWREPEEWMTTFGPTNRVSALEEIITRWGYPVESHDVTTDDGYILKMQRIPRERNSNSSSCFRPPILLVHGFMMDASAWVLNPPESSPGMILADAGFDVFLLNVRGTAGDRHVKHGRKDQEYWKFTVDEMARYDAPAAIDKVLELTGAEWLHWVGHSQGSFISYLMLSERPEYNCKIGALFELGPAGTGRYAKGLSRLALAFQKHFSWLSNMLAWIAGPRAVGFNHPWLLSIAARVLCLPHFNYEVCRDILHLIVGPPAKTYNFSRTPVYLSHLFVGTSSWNLQHKSQNAARTDVVYHFDASPDENMKRYGHSGVLPYNYTNIDSDLFLFWSRNDFLTPPESSSKWTLPRLKHGVLKGSFEIAGYNHLDFLAATDAGERVFSKIIAIARRYETNACLE